MLALGPGGGICDPAEDEGWGAADAGVDAKPGVGDPAAAGGTLRTWEGAEILRCLR